MSMHLHQRLFCSRHHARSPVLARSKAAHSSPATGEFDFVKRAVQVTVAVSLVHQMMLGRANAEQHAWRPRRHHRRMDERIPEDWAMEVAEKEVEQQEIVRRERKLAVEQARKKKEAEIAKKKADEEARILRGQQILAQTEARKDLPFSLKVGGTELVPYLIWAMVFGAVAMISRAVMERISDGRRTGGRWVYDRSLGGKKVWVADLSSIQASTQPVATARIHTDDFDRLVSVAASATSPQGIDVKSVGIPSWWNPPPSSFASDAFREVKKVEAEQQLTKIEQQKNLGQDYSLADIIKLRGICQEGGVALKTKTVGARDAIFKAAVEATVTYAQDETDASGESSLLSSYDGGEKSETRFITALAGDLSLEDDRAILITRGVVASTARARILDAVKSLKENNEMDALLALIKLSNLMQHLPVLSPYGSEPELIASSLKNASSVDERKKILYLLGQLYLDGAAIWTAMLGFRPETAQTLMDTITEEAKSKKV